MSVGERRENFEFSLTVLYPTRKVFLTFYTVMPWKPIPVGRNRHGKVRDGYPSGKRDLPCHSIHDSASVTVLGTFRVGSVRHRKADLG